MTKHDIFYHIKRWKVIYATILTLSSVSGLGLAYGQNIKVSADDLATKYINSKVSKAREADFCKIENKINSLEARQSITEKQLNELIVVNNQNAVYMNTIIKAYINKAIRG